MPRPAPKPAAKRKSAPERRTKAVVSRGPGAAAKPKRAAAAKPAKKPAGEPVASKKPAAPAAPKDRPSLKFPAAKKAEAQTPARAAAPAAAEPARSTAHLPRPGESKDAWLARVAHDYYRFLYATALSITRNNDDAEDAVQNAVVNALKRLDQLTEAGAVVSWLAMITRNAALDLLRRKKRAPGGGGDATVLPLAAPSSEKEYGLADDMRQVLANAIAVLPLSYQEVVNARHFDGLEVEDIAKRFGVTENNVRVRLFRAYEKLRESVQVRKALGLPVE